MAFNPLKTGLQAWHEADLTVASYDGVAMPTFWIDPSGTGAQSFQITAGGPLLKYNQNNGHPAVRFNGSTDYYTSTANLTQFMSAAQGTVIVVFRCTQTPSNDANIERNTGIFATGDPGANTNHFMGLHLRNVGGTTPTLYAYGFDGATKSVSLPFTMSQWGIAIWAHGNSGNLYVGYNDENSLVAVACGNLTSVSVPPRIAIGTATVNQFFGGEIAAVLCYTSPMLTTLQLGQVLNYLRAKYAIPVSPGIRGDALEQARALASDHQWRKRRSIVVATPPPMPMNRMPAAGIDLAQDFGIYYPYGPDLQGLATKDAPTGWAQDKWRRRSMRVRKMVVDLDKKTIQPELRDNSRLLVTYASTEVAARSLNLQRQGVLTVGKAPARAYTRDGYAWVPDVVSGLYVRIDPNQEKLSTLGNLLEPYARNELARSSFVSGTTGLTLSGTAVNGSAIAVDTAAAYMMFDTTVTVNSLKFTAGSPHAADLYAQWPAFTTPGAINNFFSGWHYDDNAEALKWAAQRSSDSKWWNDTASTWDVGIVWNSFALSGAGFVRGDSKAILMPAAGTVTFRVGLPSGGTASRKNHLYHVQCESWIYIDNAKRSAGGVTTPIVTDATAGLFRGADILRVYDNNGIISTGPFTLELQYQPTAIAPTTDFSILGWGDNSTNSAFLELNNAGSQLRLNMGSGAAFATVPFTPTLGTVYNIAIRFSPNGEWGEPTNQVDLFCWPVGGAIVKGTGVARDISAYPNKAMDWSNMLRNLNNNGDQVANACGYIKNVRFWPRAKPDQELAYP